MAISYDIIKSVTADLFASALKKIPSDTKIALQAACACEREETGRNTLRFMLAAAEQAEMHGKFLCSDAGFPSYHIEVGTRAQIEGNITQAIVDGFDQLCRTIEPPIMQFVTDPLTNRRSFSGRHVPPVSYDFIGDADFIDITCAPKALATGRWSTVEIFVSPTLDTIEDFIVGWVAKAAPQVCAPGVIGVGIGGTFDLAAKLAALATLRPIGQPNADLTVADMERRLLEAVNGTGFGPMGTGGNSTALAVHVDTASGHGYTPVAVTFSCWINRRTRARIYNSGKVERNE